MDIYRIKKKVVLLLATILLLTSISLGATFYVESITVGDTPVGLSADALDSNLKLGTFSCEGGNVRWWTSNISFIVQRSRRVISLLRLEQAVLRG